MNPPPLDPRALRDAFGAFITGVTVVTALDGERPVGFTANSFASVSLQPPLLLVCLAKTSRNFTVMTGATGFAVNILSEHQQDVSNTFARSVEDRFAGVVWEKGPFGAPVLPDAAAWFDCSVAQVVDAGDHVILIGRVEGFANSGHNGLGYARGSYFTPEIAAKALQAATEPETEVAAIIERDGSVLLLDRGEGRFGLPRWRLEGSDPVAALAQHVRRQIGLGVSVGFLFAVYEDRTSGHRHIVYRTATLDSISVPETGRFFPIADLPLDQAEDAATRDIFTRFAEESMLGNHGVYFGNETVGQVHPLGRIGLVS